MYILILENDIAKAVSHTRADALKFLEDKYSLNPAELDDLANGECCLITHNNHELELALTEIDHV